MPYNFTATEKKWQQYWLANKSFRALDPAEAGDMPKAYVLDMFPYPSGAGLHVGHPEGYTATDIVSRYLRMKGYNVLHPMGWDAFGLPAEQYAVKTNTHPSETTRKNIETFRRQIQMLGLSYDWDREVDTTDPAYYKWTQWIFLQLFNSYFDPIQERAMPIGHLVNELQNGNYVVAPDGTIHINPTQEGMDAISGDVRVERLWTELTPDERREVIDGQRLAYQAEVPVNWCPGLGTVLSNEEVIDGKSEVGGFPVERRPMRQWMLRITAYADRLVEDLDLLQWPESLKEMQRNWIGKSVGAEVDFEVVAADEDVKRVHANRRDTGDTTEEDEDLTITVFTTRPDTLYGATYMVLAPEHPLVDRITPTSHRETIESYRKMIAGKSDRDRMAEAKEKTGVFTGAHAINPVNDERIPVYIADYVLMGYGTGAIMAVPAHDERDFAFAKKFNLPIKPVVRPASGEAPLDVAFVGEGFAINSAVINDLPTAEAKERIISVLERDGTGKGSVKYKLRDWLFSRQRYWGEPFPIVLDEAGNAYDIPEAELPLKLPEMSDFKPTGTPEPPLSKATDWLRVESDNGVFTRETNTMPQWAGSCWYYLRYIDPKNEQRFVDPEKERYWMPVDLYVGGVEHAVLHLLYARFWHKVLFDLGYLSSSEPYHRLVNQGYLQLPAYTNRDGFYVEASRVEEHDGRYFFEGDEVNVEFGKIGKSLKNVVTPDEFIAGYGADTFRLFEMFSGPLEQSRPWDAKAIVGPYRLLQRLWRVVVDESSGAVHVSDADVPDELNRLLHKTIAAVREGYETLRFNTSIARITELNNAVTQAYPSGGAPRAVAEAAVLMLAPLAPHIAEELWSRLGHDDSLAWAPFPAADPALLVDDTVEVPVQVNGKLRAVIQAAADADATALEAAARADEKVAAALDGRQVRRVVAVPGRLVNFVV
jgi:leucyl-tRNA synthetase